MKNEELRKLSNQFVHNNVDRTFRNKRRIVILSILAFLITAIFIFSIVATCIWSPLFILMIISFLVIDVFIFVLLISEYDSLKDNTKLLFEDIYELIILLQETKVDKDEEKEIN